MNLDECFSKLSTLKRHHGTDESLLSRIYEIVENDDECLPNLIGQIAFQNRATIRALWRFAENRVVSFTDEKQKSVIYNAFKSLEDGNKKVAMMSMVLTYGKSIFDIKSREKIHPSIWKWCLRDVIRKLVKLDKVNFVQMAFSVNLINQLISRNSTDQNMIGEFQHDIFLPLKESIKLRISQLNVEYISSVSIVLVNLAKITFQRETDILYNLDLNAIQVEDPVYEIFISRSLLSLKLKQRELTETLLTRLISIAIHYREKLDPTHLCNNIRGLAESIEIRRHEVSCEFYRKLEPIFDTFGEHPLDVVRVNVWKMFQFSIESKVAHFENNRMELAAQIQKLKNQKMHKRFTLIKLSVFCEQSVTYKLLEQICGESIIRSIVRSSSIQALTALSAEVITKVSRIRPDNVVEELVDYFEHLCLETDRSENVSNAKRLFQDVLLPKVLKNNKSIGALIQGRCFPYSNLNMVQMAIIVSKAENKEYSLSSLSYDSFKKSLTHYLVQVRLSSFSFLISGKKTATVFSSEQMEFIKIGIGANMNLHKPLYRGQFLGTMTKLLARFDASWSNFEGDIYKKFTAWLIETCIGGLSESGSMPRILTSLSILNLVVKLKNSNFALFRDSILNDRLHLHTAILAQLRNSFTEINFLAFDILLSIQHVSRAECIPKLLPSKTQESYVSTVVEKLRHSCSIATCTGLALELAYAIHIESASLRIPLWKMCSNVVAEIVEIVQNDFKQYDIIEACTKNPHYGLLNGLEVIFKYAREAPSSVCNILVNDIMNLCFTASKYADPVINSSSPEGFLPDLKDEFLSNIGTKSESTETAKLLLVMSWRIMKSSSVILGDLGETFNMNFEAYAKCGQHFIRQLTRARHRGAFELSAAGFRNLCIQTRRSSDGVISVFINKWLEEAFGLFEDDSKMYELCNTRRSAGVPYLFSALACADAATSKSKDLLKNIIATLFPIATQNEKLCDSCHARNILRMIFRESSIGEETLSCAEEALMFCILGFGDLSWALRNSSAMLYATLCSRIFGVKKSVGLEDEEKMSSSEFFNRFRKLEEFLLHMLERGAAEVPDRLNPTLLPVLLIIQRLIPTGASRNEGRYIKALLVLVKSKVWKCRVSAARCVYALNNNPVAEMVNTVSNLINETKDQNALHGYLLILDQFKGHSEFKTKSLQTMLVTILGTLSYPSAAIAIRILSENDLLSKDVLEYIKFVKCHGAKEYQNIGEFELYQACSAYLIKFKQQNEISEILLSKNNPNAIRAMVTMLDDPDCFDFLTQNVKMFAPIFEDLIFLSSEDETLVAAVSIFSSIAEKGLIKRAFPTWREHIVENIEHVKNPEYVGFLLEIVEKYDMPILLDDWLLKGSSAEQHFSMRMSCAIVCSNLISKEIRSPTLVQVAFTLLSDEDDEVRLPLVKEIGEISFEVDGFCAVTQILPTPKSKTELTEYVNMITQFGFFNENMAIRLFEMDDEKSTFQLSQLNMHYEPLIMTKLAISALKVICDKIDYEWLVIVSKLLTDRLMELDTGKENGILKKQIISMSDFIASL